MTFTHDGSPHKDSVDHRGRPDRTDHQVNTALKVVSRHTITVKKAAHKAVDTTNGLHLEKRQIQSFRYPLAASLGSRFFLRRKTGIPSAPASTP